MAGLSVERVEMGVVALWEMLDLHSTGSSQEILATFFCVCLLCIPLLNGTVVANHGLLFGSQAGLCLSHSAPHVVLYEPDHMFLMGTNQNSISQKCRDKSRKMTKLVKINWSV